MSSPKTGTHISNSIIVTIIFLLLSLVTPSPTGLGQQRSGAEPLSPGRQPARTLKPGETYSYKVRLKAGEYFHVDVEQLSTDVELLLLDQNAKVVVKRDRPNGARDQESLSFIAVTSGDYRLDVKALDENVAAGEYELNSERPRKPGKQDRERVKAENLFQEGRDLSKTRSVESVKKGCAKYDSAVPLWRGVGDKYAEALTQTSLGFCRQAIKEYEKAASAHERAVALYRELGRRWGEALSLGSLCILNVARQDADAGLAQCREAKAIYRETNDADGEKDLNAQLRVAAESYLEIVAKLDQRFGAKAYPAEMKLLGLAHAIYGELGDKNRQGVTLLATGRMSSSAGRKQLALSYYDKALPLFLEAGNKLGMAMTFVNVGAAYSALGDKKKAFDYYERRALPLYQEIPHKQGIAETLNHMGRVCDDLGERKRALDYYNQALPIFSEIKEPSGIATTLNNIGRVYGRIGDKRKALDYYNQALPLRKEAKDEIGEAITLVNIGSVYADLGDVRRALDYFDNQALPLHRKLGNKSGEATTLNNIGRVYDSLGDRQTALDYYENKALPVFREIEDKSGMATTYLNIGGIYVSIGDAEKALDYFENKALPLFKEIEEKSGIATTLNNIGIAYSALGDKQKALDYYEKQVLPLLEDLGNMPGQAATLNNIGRVYAYFGEKQMALKYYKDKALPFYLKVEDKAGIAATLNNIGSAYEDLGDRQTARDYYENQALPLYRQLEDKAGVAMTLNNIGHVYSGLGNKVKALDYYETQALPLRKEVGDRQGEAVTLNNIGSVYFALGNKRKALDYYIQALPLNRATGDKENEGRTLSNIMFVWSDLKKPRLAIFYGKQCVNAYQQIRVKNLGVEKEFQKTLLRSVEDFYRYLAALLIEQGRPAEAAQVLNAFKDERAFDFNLKRENRPSPLGLTVREADFGARYATAADNIGGLVKQAAGLRLITNNRTPPPQQATRFQRLESDLKNANDEFAAILRQAETEFDQPTDPAKDGEPVIDEIREMQRVLQSLNKGNKNIALYTLVGEDKFYALAIPSDASENITAVTSPIRGARLNNKARQLWALLQSNEYDPRPLSKEIYALIFKPIKDKLGEQGRLNHVLPEGTTILWSLDGNLRYLPMAALYDGEKYLAERYNNVVFTRADVKQWMRDASPRWTGLGFGSSQATPNAVRELRAIFNTHDSKTGVFDGLIFTDAAFTRDAMRTALKEQRQLVHISSHFYFSPGDSKRSFLTLGDKNVLSLNEMKSKIDFRGVELLTLSACETAAQWPNADGREVDGFAELAQRLGAASVLATLWNIRADSSYWLMREFYHRKQDVTRETKAESLRQAQLALLNGTAKVAPLAEAINKGAKKDSGNSTIVKILSEGRRSSFVREEGFVYVEAKYAIPYMRSDSKPYAHPYFWSSFVLFGNWH